MASAGSFIYSCHDAAVILLMNASRTVCRWVLWMIVLLPVIGIIPVGNNAMADRYILFASKAFQSCGVGG
jgi:hypothetical protein